MDGDSLITEHNLIDKHIPKELTNINTSLMADFQLNSNRKIQEKLNEFDDKEYEQFGFKGKKKLKLYRSWEQINALLILSHVDKLDVKKPHKKSKFQLK